MPTAAPIAQSERITIRAVLTRIANPGEAQKVLVVAGAFGEVRQAQNVNVTWKIKGSGPPNRRSKMIVMTGLLKLLDLQRTGLGGYEWWLFDNDATIVIGTVLADLNEASFTGYARQASAAWGASTSVTPRSQSVPATLPQFDNTGGSPTTIYGWALVTGDHATLIAAANIGATVIPAGLSLALSPGITDKQE